MAGRFGRTLAPTLFVAALLLTVLAGALPAQPPAQAGDEIEVLRRQASQLSRAGKYAEAIPISQRALMLAEQRFSPVAPKVAPALNDLAYLYFALNRHSEAEPLYRRLLSIHDNDPGRDDGDVWGVLRRLEAVYDAQGRENEAAPLAARARAIESKVSAPYDVGIASQEIITTDLKRLQLTDCGTIRFDVADPQKFLIYFGSVERARRYNGIAITSLLRRLLGSKTSTEIIEQAQSVVQEIRQLIDLDVEHAGISVRDMNVDLRSCATPP